MKTWVIWRTIIIQRKTWRKKKQSCKSAVPGLVIPVIPGPPLRGLRRLHTNTNGGRVRRSYFLRCVSFFIHATVTRKSHIPVAGSRVRAPCGRAPCGRAPSVWAARENLLLQPVFFVTDGFFAGRQVIIFSLCPYLYIRDGRPAHLEAMLCADSRTRA